MCCLIQLWYYTTGWFCLSIFAHSSSSLPPSSLLKQLVLYFYNYRSNYKPLLPQLEHPPPQLYSQRSGLLFQHLVKVPSFVLEFQAVKNSAHKHRRDSELTLFLCFAHLSIRLAWYNTLGFQVKKATEIICPSTIDLQNLWAINRTTCLCL